jgi:hypothetical protein
MSKRLQGVIIEIHIPELNSLPIHYQAEPKTLQHVVKKACAAVQEATGDYVSVREIQDGPDE